MRGLLFDVAPCGLYHLICRSLEADAYSAGRLPSFKRPAQVAQVACRFFDEPRRIT